MKRVILSSLIIISGCSIDTEEPEATLQEKTIQPTVIETKKIKEISPLTLAILKIEDPKTSSDIRQQQIEKIKKISAYNVDAVFYLAALYEEGKLLPLSEKKARNLYQLAAKKNHALARYYYALMLIDGRGGRVDYDNAESYLLINHNNAHTPSSYSLGYLYFIQKKHENVIKTLEKNSHQHNEYSSYLLAISYLELNKKTTIAIDLLQRSAAKGHQFSHLILGGIYRNGLYKTPINTQKSFTHLHAAAANNDPKALYDLATLSIEHLELINNDINIAINQLKTADKNGYPEASFELAKIYDQGNLIKQNFTEAIYWYKKSASHGNNKAMYNLASIYINGDGVDMSISQAEYWLKKSALQGNKRAINILSNNQ